MPLGLWQLKLMAAYYSRYLETTLGDAIEGDEKDSIEQRLISDELLEAAVNATQQWLYDWLRGIL